MLLDLQACGLQDAAGSVVARCSWIYKLVVCKMLLDLQASGLQDAAGSVVARCSWIYKLDCSCFYSEWKHKMVCSAIMKLANPCLNEKLIATVEYKKFNVQS